MVANTNRIADGFISLIAGMHEGLDVSLLAPNQFARGVNLQSRSGLVKSRLGWKLAHVLQYATKDNLQGSFIYRLNDADRLVYCAAGIVWCYNLTTSIVTRIGSLSATAQRIYFCKVDRYCVVQDGASAPLILDGDSAYSGAHTIPVGSIMAYGHGRLFLVPLTIPGVAPAPAQEGRPYFLAGDVLQPKDATTVLQFTETTYLAEGGAIGLPNELGFIKGMGFIRNAATGTGLGPLIVFARDGVSAFAVNAPRAQWKDIDFSQVLFFGPGTESDRAITSISNDLIYRANDGIRSLQYSKQEAAGSSLANISMSNNVELLMALDNFTTAQYISSEAVDNRYFVTCNYDTTSKYYQGMVIIDFTPTETFGVPSAPAYDGLYTGFKIKQLLKARKDDQDELHGLLPVGDSIYFCALTDTTGHDLTAKNIKSRLYTGVFKFNSPTVDKRIIYCDIWVKNIYDDAVVTLYWRPDGYVYWLQFGTATIKGSQNGALQRRDRIRFVPPTRYCDLVEGTRLNRSTGFQFCIEWVGALTISKFTVTADVLTEQPKVCVVETGATVLAASEDGGIELNDFYDEVSTL